LILTQKEDVLKSNPKSLAIKFFSIFSFGFLLLGIIGLMELFTAVFIGIGILVFIKVLDLKDIKASFDFDLLILLVSALAIGVSLSKSGAADMLALKILYLGDYLGIISIITVLFVVTLILTSLITNPAAVSIIFPIAASLSEKLNIDSTPFFVAIAFAASGDFITPIGYQTNLMIMGPGGYTFKDYFKVGFPLTILYSIVCISFILIYYNLINE
jgi:di/tricarboxylate transporter